MFRIILFLLLLLPANVFAYECNKEIDKLSSEYEIPIICKKSSVGNKKPAQQFDEVEELLLQDTSKVFASFLRSYEKKFIKSKLEKIYIFSNIKYRGSRVAGLSNGQEIWISIKEYAIIFYTHIHLLETLHHEFSSNIYRNYPQRHLWSELSDYGDDDILLNKCLNDINFSTSTSPKLLSQGFLINYSKTNEENDFNVFAEYLFTKNELLLEAKKTYPKINLKLEMLKRFYRNAGYTGKFPDET